MISTVGTIYSHSWTVTAYGARHVTDGQTEKEGERLHDRAGLQGSASAV